MKAREEREHQQELEEMFAPVGTPDDYAKSHSTGLYKTMSSNNTRTSRRRMVKPVVHNPHHLQFPKYYEFQDEQPLYPFPLEDAMRTESQNNHATNSKLMAR